MIKKKIKYAVLFIYKNYVKYKTYKEELNNLKKQKKLFKSINLTKKQIEKIDKLWVNNYGKTISKDWHRLYTAYNNQFNEKYFPEIFFTTNLLNKLNSEDLKKSLSDKMLTQYFFNNIPDSTVKVAKNIIYNSNGYYYSQNGIISENEAINILSNINEAIIKPTTETSSGQNVMLINIKNGIDIISKKNINEILKKYKNNFTIQEKIKPHPKFSKLNPTSINTIRVNTYIYDGKVYASPTTMRIGRKGKIIDNAHGGGVTIGIDENGCLMRYAFLQSGEKFEKHPDNDIKFYGYKIPRVLDMIEFAKNNHYRIPGIGIIAWDLTLDENENIIIIETNINCPSIWFPQYSTGKAFFGNNTENMIKMLKK